MDHDQRFKTLIKVFFRDFLLLFFQEWALRLMRFEYLYVGLAALDGVEYVRKDNWLAVALSVLTKIPPNQVAWLGAEALQRIQAAPLTDQQRFLLAECVQAYLPLDESQQREFERLVATEKYQGVQAMNATSYQKGIEKERRESVRELLAERFGPLSPGFLQKLKQLPLERVPTLRKAILKAESLQELGLDD